MKYYRNTYNNNELCHWKYIKKIPVGKGYRYFYTWDEYRAFLKDPTAELQKVGDKIGQEAKNFSRAGKQEIDAARKSTSKTINNGKNKVENTLKKISASKMTVGSVKAANASVAPEKRNRLNELAERIKSKWSSASENIKETAEKGKQWVSNLFKEKPRERNKEDEKEKEQYKYVDKVKINGKYRYFYSKEELDAYNKRKEYQKDEPDYLKKLKHSEDPYTSEEDAILVNPKISQSNNSDWQNNCAECTAIYEMRRRGYDVESNGISGQPNSIFLPFKIKEYIDAYKYNTEGRFERLYENPNIQNVEPTKTYLDEETKDKATARAIEREILKNPPGSRGDISVQWKEGGGHSMVWEIDKDGKVHIIDAQASGYGNKIEYDLDSLAKKVDNSSRRIDDPRKSYTTITRTDNLVLKEDCTKICRNSKKRKRKPSENKIDISDLENVKTEPMSDKERVTLYPTLSEKERKK